MCIDCTVSSLTHSRTKEEREERATENVVTNVANFLFKLILIVESTIDCAFSMGSMGSMGSL